MGLLHKSVVCYVIVLGARSIKPKLWLHEEEEEEEVVGS